MNEPNVTTNKITHITTRLPEDQITFITEGEYQRLLKAGTKLNALEAAGVDNWSGYDYAMGLMEGEIYE